MRIHDMAGRTVATLCMVLALVSSTLPAVAGALDVAGRREQVIQAATRGVDGMPVLRAALEDSSVLVRRAAVQNLVRVGTGAHEALEAALSNSDPVVRRTALLALAGEPTPAGVPLIAKAIADADPLVREAAVQWLVLVRPAGGAVTELLRQAGKDPSPEIQVTALTALAALAPTAGVAFHPPPRDTVLLRQRPDMVDHINSITVVASLPLPSDGWRFSIDPARDGHAKKWFAPEFDDGSWNDMAIETPWMADYIGVGWYRRTLDLPARPKHLAAEMVFMGVDECAWVWVNGIYVGGQDIGPEGWNQPFRVDVTSELRWGAPNQITVRVMNTANAGGIWSPVRIEALGGLENR